MSVQELTPLETDLPSSWAMVELGEIAAINPSTSLGDLGDDADVSFVPMKAVQEQSGVVDVSGIRKLSDVRKGYTAFQDGDILFAKITPCMENGKVAIVNSLVNGRGFGSTEFHVIRLFEPALAKFYFYYFVQESMRRDARSNMTGTAGQLRVPGRYLEFLQVPLPSVVEINRIVARIDELITDLDAGVSALHRAKRLVAQYRLSVLKAAVEGELSRAWREANPNLLKPVAELTDAEASTDAPERQMLPFGWTWTPFSQLLREGLCNGLSIKGSDIPTSTRSLKLSAISDNGFNYSEYRYLPIDISELTDLLIKAGDFFISRGNGTLKLLARGCVAQAPPFPVIFPDTMIRARLEEALSQTGWVPAIWGSPVVRRQIESKAKTTAGIWKVSQGDLKALLVPIPPIEEQRFLVSEIDRLLSGASNLEVEIDAALRRCDLLRQAIFKQAFSGHLVPQEPTDEPVGKLLERIREAKEQSKAVPAKRDRKPKKKEAAHV